MKCAPIYSKHYGKDYLPAAPLTYRTRAVSAQEAHEAIRPTSVLRSPEKVKPFLSADQFKLYQLIWKRFVACQMESAVYDTLAVEITTNTANHSYLFRASGSTLKFPGFLVVYEEMRDEDLKISEDEEAESCVFRLRWKKGRSKNWCAWLQNSTSPSRRRVLAKHRWCRYWKNTALAGLRPMRRSSRPFRNAATLLERINASSQPKPGSWSIRCWSSISRKLWI